jgi:hypothetical protein
MSKDTPGDDDAGWPTKDTAPLMPIGDTNWTLISTVRYTPSTLNFAMPSKAGVAK